MPGIAAESASLLYALQPLAGAALALNLAYLNLEKFRYRKSIREPAGDCLKALRADDQYVRAREETEYFCELRYLAALPNNDKIGNKRADKNNADKKTRPRGFWAWLYAWGYSWHQDKAICFVAAAVSVLMLIVGAGHALGLLGFIEPRLKSERIGLPLWLLLSVFTVWPMALVLTAGYYIVPCALNRIEHNKTQIKKFLAREDMAEAGYSQP